MTREPALFPAHKRHGVLLAALGWAVLAVMTLMGYLIWSGYREAILTAETTSRNYAAIIEARLDATLRRADAHLQELARDLPIAAFDKQATPRYAREIDAGLDLRLLNFPELAGLRVFDAGGDLLYTSDRLTTPSANISDRDHFRQAREGPHDSLVFSEVLSARTMNNKQSLIINKAVRDEQGAFRGIVTAAIELDYFHDLFQSLDVGPHGVISIYRRDNLTQVVRWPLGGVGINQPLPPGNPTYEVVASGKKLVTLEFPASTDGTVRTYSYDLLTLYPFFVAVGLAHEDVLAGWRARSLAVGLSGLLLVLLLAGLLYRLWRSEERLREATSAAESANQAKTMFLANMSHELRTPLNAVIGFSQLIKDQAFGLIGNDRYVGYARDILNAGQHLLTVINGVLDLSRVEAGKYTMREDPVDVHNLVQASLSLVRVQAEEKRITLSDAVGADLPCVLADETALRQIVTNLLSNAVKFTPAGGCISVSAEREPQGGMVLTVADTGAGMTGEEIVRAMEPFVQVEDPLVKRHEGTGLGLPIAKRFTELLGGALEISSEKNVGTAVRVHLPAARVLPPDVRPERGESKPSSRKAA